jgi:hypothetical protein
MVRWFVKHRRFFTTFLILSSILAAFLLYQFVFSPLCAIKDVSIREINSDPPSFDGAHVKLEGRIVDSSVYIFGPKYVLREFDDGVEVALGGKGSIEKVDLKPYVSFVFDGSNYTHIRDLRVSVVGYVRYIGLVTDAPSFYLDVEKVEPIVTELEIIVTEFLKTTDVPNGGWDGARA